MQGRWNTWLGGAVVLALVGAGAFYLGARKAPQPFTPTAATAAQTARPAGPAADPYLAGPVKNTLRKEAPAMQQLWLTYLQKPGAKEAGAVELNWRIDSQGRVSHVGVVHSELNDKTLEDGLVLIVSRLSFPMPDVPQKYVAHTFNFKKEDASR